MADQLAILTGDIVGSSRLASDELDGALAALAEAAEAAARWADRPGRFTRFRGDGWQCVAPSPALALRAALFLRACLRRRGRGLDSRIAIGIGGADLPRTETSGGLGAAGGPAFALSGRGLDRLDRPARLAVAWQDPPPAAAALGAMIACADEISRRWTPAQAGVLVRLLPPGNGTTQAEIGTALGISQQMVAKHRRAAGEWALARALAAFEDGS